MKMTKIHLLILTVLTPTLFISCQNQQMQDDLAKFQEVEAVKDNNIEVIKEVYKLLDEQNLDACGELFSTDSKGYMGSSNEPVSFEDIKPVIRNYYTAFQGYAHEIENIFASNDFVVAQLNYTGTHMSNFMGIDSTGNTIDYKGIHIFKLIDGKISEFWVIEDDLTMMTQLDLELKQIDIYNVKPTGTNMLVYAD